MPLVGFNCECGNVLIKDCLKSCPKGDRCLSISTLHKIGQTKEYTHGKFSTTLLLKPTRQAFLEITSDYFIEPSEQAWMISGREHHARLQEVADKLKDVKAELPVRDWEITSVIDNLEPDELNQGSFKLVDFKFVGAFSIVKLLRGDYSGYDWQVNHYKTQLTRLNIPISRLFIQYTARDLTGKTAAEFKDIFTKKMGLIPIPIYPESEVLEYFDIRRERLQMALAKNELPPICEDRWTNDNRCKSFCSVSANCEHGRKYLEAKEAREAVKATKTPKEAG